MSLATFSKLEKPNEVIVATFTVSHAKGIHQK
jgi:hypothetical protein